MKHARVSVLLIACLLSISTITTAATTHHKNNSKKHNATTTATTKTHHAVAKHKPAVHHSKKRSHKKGKAVTSSESLKQAQAAQPVQPAEQKQPQQAPLTPPVAQAPAAQTSAQKPSTPAPTTGFYPIASGPTMIPAPPDFAVKGYILVDANSGAIIAGKNSTAHLPPASITKLMSLYLFANALKTGQIHPDNQVTISENAWKMGGSKMFIKVGATIPVKQLIDGIVIASGNDATVAMAEYLNGSEDAFVKIMNQTAAKLGMTDTNYADSNGLPATNHYSSAKDIATLARAWLRDFPEYYSWFSQKWIVYNGIKQPNRNRLLWRDSSADGIKTGHTDEAGYCLVGSAVRNGMRLIAVIMGAPSDSTRFNDTENLLNYGFRFYESHKIFAANQALANPRIWLCKENNAKLGFLSDFYVTVPANQYANLKANMEIPKVIKGPLEKGQECGMVKITLNGKVVASRPLVALNSIEKAGIFSRLFDHLALLFY